MWAVSPGKDVRSQENVRSQEISGLPSLVPCSLSDPEPRYTLPPLHLLINWYRNIVLLMTGFVLLLIRYSMERCHRETATTLTL